MTRALRRPNLFVIGAMKSGTTSLHEYLDTHPQIAMSVTKEPGYFVEELSLDKGEDWYVNLFAQDEQYLFRGESSTHYTKLPIYRGVAERIHRFCPDARLIYIMRDPFERILSHYWHNVRDAAHGGEVRPLLKAVQERPDYLAFSDYAMQLEPYLERFGPQTLHTLTFESLVDNPQRELDRLYQWLGLPPVPFAREQSTAHNQKPKTMAGVAGLGILNRIQYSDAWDRISPYMPGSLKVWAKRRAYAPIDERATERLVPALRRELDEPLRHQIEQLSRLLGRDFPEWNSTRSTVAIRTQRS